MDEQIFNLTQKINELHEKISELDNLIHQHRHREYDSTQAVEILGGNRGIVRIPKLPTASAELADQSLWNDSGTIKIV